MLTECLIESRAHRWDINKAAVLPLVVGIHLLVLGVLTISSIWRIPYLEEVPISVSVVGAIPPGVPGPSRNEGNRQQPRRTDPVREFAPPTEIPPFEPRTLTEEEGDVEDPAWTVDGSIDFGPGPGGPGPGSDPKGWLPGEIPRKPLPVDNLVYQIGGEIMGPVRTTPLQPLYPEAARKAGIQGPVTLELTISRKGEVTSVKVVRGLPMGVNDAAMAEAWKQHFQPAFKSSTGEPVACVFTLTVFFRLN